MINTRFAPSPTGEPHIGNFRTALFEYLAAKHEGGNFYLRIEDTDRTRYVEGSVEKIIAGLKWLGLAPDNINKIMYQSARLDIYKKFALQLVDEGKAYICTCTKEQLDDDRKQQEASKKPTGYMGHCREKGIKIEDVEEGKYVIRMKMPREGKIVFDDMVRGRVEFDLSLSDDQIILKSDGFPTYHLAAVVDDHEMKTTYAIRGEEWLSSTPKHLILYQMFGWDAPKFAHLSMILAPDKAKLSKRHGATGLTEYKALGYLPEAIVNFLALLGWNPGDEREFFTLLELEKEFTLDHVNKAPAVFNMDKLNSINQYYLSRLIQDSKPRICQLLSEFDLDNISDGELDLLGRGGYKTLREMADAILELRKEPEYEAKILVFKKSDIERTKLALEKAIEILTENDEWNSTQLQEKLSMVVSQNNLTNGDVFWAVRVALSGKERSPSPVELMLALGQIESNKRLNIALEKLATIEDNLVSS